MPTLRFHLTAAQRRRTASVDVDTLVIAGWTGRDAADVAAHVRELAALGVPPPRTTPLFYRVSAQLLTQASLVQVLGGETSGEAEAVIVSCGGGLWVGVGSDHTDRRMERMDVASAKQCCAKSIGPKLWPLAEVAGHWDCLILRSHLSTAAGRELYQEGPLAALQTPLALIEQYTGKRQLAEGTALFCGTLPVRGPVRGGLRFEMELWDPVRRRVLRHGYALQELPVVR